jgi:hypothetical protein
VTDPGRGNGGMSERIRPWDQQAGETARAFAAFQVYRDLPAKSRSLERAASIYYGQEVGRTIGGTSGKVRQFETWSSRWDWVPRVAQYDRHIDRAATATHAEEVAAMAARHAATAMRMVEKAAEALEKVDVDDLSPGQLALFFELGVKIERLSRGEPDTESDLTAGEEQDTIRDLLGRDPELAALWGELAARAAHVEAESRGAPSNETPFRRRTRRLDTGTAGNV